MKKNKPGPGQVGARSSFKNSNFLNKHEITISYLLSISQSINTPRDTHKTWQPLFTQPETQKIHPKSPLVPKKELSAGKTTFSPKRSGFPDQVAHALIKYGTIQIIQKFFYDLTMINLELLWSRV